MKRLLILSATFLIALAASAQFSDTASLNKYIRDTIKDRRPEKVTAEQIQKAIMGTANLGAKRTDSVASFDVLPKTVADEYLKEWKAQTTPADRVWVNLAWSPELRLMVAVSHGGTSDGVMTSPDGVNWTLGTCPAQEWRGVAWSPKLKLFAAVGGTGTGNRVMTSPDGKVWTNRASTGDYKWRDIVWADKLGMFVAVANTPGYTNKVMTSTDGMNWVARSCPDQMWADIVWAPEIGLFVVSAEYTSYLPGGKIMTSPDGINWTQRTTPADGGSWQGVTWSPELHLFVSVCYKNPGDGLDATRVMTSPDGINWTLRATPGNNQWLSVAWSRELNAFAAVADDTGGDGVMTSHDGINWVSQYPDVNRNWRRIYWVKELGSFCAIAYTYATSGVGSLFMKTRAIDGNQQYLNLNGRSTKQTVSGTTEIKDLRLPADSLKVIKSGAIEADKNAAYFTNSYGYRQRITSAIDTNFSKYIVSNWTLQKSTEDNTWLNVVWAKELSMFVAVSTTGTNRVAISYNGINWTAKPAAVANAWRGLAWSPDLRLFVAVASNGTNRVMTSPDGINWTERACPVQDWRVVLWVPELKLFVAFSRDGINTVMTSPDGINWTSRTTPTANPINAAAWSPEIRRIVAVSNMGGTLNKVMTSTDGINWTVAPIQNKRTWESVAWSPSLGLFVAIAYNSDEAEEFSGAYTPTGTAATQIMYSKDGTNWSYATAPVKAWLSCVWAEDLGAFVAVNDNADGNGAMYSFDGINWTLAPTPAVTWRRHCYSKELGVFVAVGYSGTGQRFMTSKFAKVVKLNDVLNLIPSAAPTGTADAGGSEGDLRRDAAGNLYLKSRNGLV